MSKVYSVKEEAKRNIESFTKAMNTIEERYPKEAQGRIVRLCKVHFGTDATIEMIQELFNKGQYSIIVARTRQAAHAQAELKKSLEKTSYSFEGTVARIFGKEAKKNDIFERNQKMIDEVPF